MTQLFTGTHYIRIVFRARVYAMPSVYDPNSMYSKTFIFQCVCVCMGFI